MNGRTSKRFSAAPELEDRVVASLAHEINNPLQSLLNFLYLMDAEGCLSDRGKDYLLLAREEANRIARIAHAAMSKLSPRDGPEQANVPELLRSVIEFYHSRLISKNISVSARYCLHGDLTVYPDALRQTFSNLLLNAVDALPKGGTVHARVRFSREYRGAQRHGLRVTFADNGMGISPDDLPKVMQPFFTTKGAGGTGIGLALVKHTVHKHGGELRVRSCTREGRSGSVFAIFLPAA